MECVKLCDLISPEYQEQNKQLHEQARGAGKPWGMSGYKYVDDVIAFCAELTARGILDYGCGSSSLRDGIMRKIPILISEYDPAIPGRDSLPVPADIVTCTDVMEHVEEDKVPAVLKHIHDLSLKGCYIVIALNDTDHKLPDGRSAHITIKSASWWVKNIRQFPWKIDSLLANDKVVKIWLKK